MRNRHLMISLTLTCALILGCGGGEEEVAEDAPAHGQGHATETLETTVTPAVETEEPAASIGFSPPFPTNDNPFAPPQQLEEFVEEEEEEEIDPYLLQDDMLANMPPMRLLGFVKVKNQKRALLSFDGETKLVALGDRLKHMEVVGVDFPNLTLRHFETQLAMNLFEQEWQNMPGGNRRGVRGDTSKTSDKAKADRTKVKLPELPPPGAGSSLDGLPGFPDFEAPPETEKRPDVPQ